MKHSKWKKWLSYFTEITLEETSSPYNEILDVLLVKGRHQLATEDAIYSWDDKYENFAKLFHKLDLTSLPNNRVLVLGLGLGSVIYILEKKHHLALEYLAVEIDPEICRLAEKYTLSDLNSYTEVVTTDALSFINCHEETYGLVIMDIFQSADIPEVFNSPEYLDTIKSLLDPSGLLLYNRMGITDENIATNGIYDKTFGNAFPNMVQVPIENNAMYVSDKSYVI